MNKLIQLSQNWHSQASRNLYSSFPQLPNGKIITAQDVQLKYLQLKNLKDNWTSKQDLITGAIISAYYDEVLPKTRRIKQLFRTKTSTKGDPNNYIVGIRYKEASKSLKHIITYHVSMEVLNKTIAEVKACLQTIQDEFNERITNQDLITIKNSPTKYFKNKSEARRFSQIIVDLYSIVKFGTYQEDIDDSEPRIISFYKLKNELDDSEYLLNVLRKLGINKTSKDTLDKNVILLDNHDLKILKAKGSFLVYTQSKDLFETRNSFQKVPKIDKYPPLPMPKSEPVIGVLDTLYNETDYFKDWVEYENDDQGYETDTLSNEHGNQVTSIIVAGPRYNPGLEDNCGLFRVHHFGISNGGKDSSFKIMKRIKEIVKNHPEIHVWNLSLGSPYSTNKNHISNEAAVIDQLQTENPNVLFIIAGTNLEENALVNNKLYNRIGAPADSVNSLVVNSITQYGKPASYSRKGPVLHYFVKPDVCYYGGDVGNPLTTIQSSSSRQSFGTSFAAPWIARKASFLIDKMHFSREMAKALIIDSASGWLTLEKDPKYMGYGIVPLKIEDVINCKSDEIRFIIEGFSNKRETYSDPIPIPLNSIDKFPFISRATLTYFPPCSQNQGVDYTDKELSLQFGRIKADTSTSIKAITNDNDIEKKYLHEAGLRQIFSKWQNVKIHSEKFSPRKKSKNKLGKGFWGLKLISSERLSGYKQGPFKFAVVVTLKNLKGQNLNERFKQLCIYNNWRITDIDIGQRLEANVEATEDIEWTKE